MEDKVFVPLVKKAGFVLWEDESYKPSGALVDWASEYDKELNTFGNLVVEECLQVLQARFMGDLNREDMEVRRCMGAIKKHFYGTGVKNGRG